MNERYRYACMRLGIDPAELVEPDQITYKELLLDSELAQLYVDAHNEWRHCLEQQIAKEVACLEERGLSDVECAFLSDEHIKLPKLYSNERDYQLLLRRIQSEINRTQEQIAFRKLQEQVAASHARQRPVGVGQHEDFLAQTRQKRDQTLQNKVQLDSQLSAKLEEQQRDAQRRNQDFDAGRAALAGKRDYLNKMKTRTLHNQQRKQQQTEDFKQEVLRRLQAQDNEPKATRFQNYDSWAQKTERERPRFQKALQLKHEKETGAYFDSQARLQMAREKQVAEQYEKVAKERADLRHEKNQRLLEKQRQVYEAKQQKLAREQDENDRLQRQYDQDTQNKKDNPQIEKLRLLQVKRQQFADDQRSKQQLLNKLTKQRQARLQHDIMREKIEQKKFILQHEIAELNKQIQYYNGDKRNAQKIQELGSQVQEKQDQLTKLERRPE